MNQYGIYQEMATRLLEAVRNSEISEPEKLCGPFAIEPTEEFLSAQQRILYVGQETFGWDTTIGDFLDAQDGLARALRHYREFGLGEDMHSPFWLFHRTLAKCLGLHPKGLLWSNLVRFGLQKAPGQSASIIKLPHPSAHKLLDVQKGILVREIEGLQIKSVVFVTGPDYDSIIRDEFGDVEFRPIPQISQRLASPWLLDAIVSNKLPDLRMIRTYHPKFLQMKEIDGRIAEEIARYLQTS